MRVQQISVFIENHPGRLEAILEVLDKKQISMRALSISETAEFGIVRMILSDTDKGIESLREAGFTARADWILAAEIPDVPGALLNHVVKPLTEAGVNLKYFYAFMEPNTDKAMAVLKTDDIDKAEQVLKAQ